MSAAPTIKVALVEDDTALVTMYRAKLEHEGMEVRTASDGQSAMELMSSFPADIVLLDVIMPDSTGLELLTYLRSRKENDGIKVIVMTNLDDTKMVKSMEDMGISGYLVKAEVTPMQVVSKIYEVLGRPISQQ